MLSTDPSGKPECGILCPYKCPAWFTALQRLWGEVRGEGNVLNPVFQQAPQEIMGTRYAGDEQVV